MCRAHPRIPVTSEGPMILISKWRELFMNMELPGPPPFPAWWCLHTRVNVGFLWEHGEGGGAGQSRKAGVLES